jgi:hypothetical protein
MQSTAWRHFGRTNPICCGTALQSCSACRISTVDFGRTKPILIARMSSRTRYFWQNEANLIGKGLNASRAVGPQRSSKMTLPSFGRVPIGTNSTDPLSFVTPRSVVATSLCSASVGDASVLIGIARKEAEEWRTDPEKRQVLDAMMERTIKRLMQIKTMKQMYGRLEPKLINLSVTKNPPAQDGIENR